jgi:hypothetical protein
VLAFSFTQEDRAREHARDCNGRGGELLERRQASVRRARARLDIVEQATWAERNDRLAAAAPKPRPQRVVLVGHGRQSSPEALQVELAPEREHEMPITGREAHSARHQRVLLVGRERHAVAGGGADVGRARSGAGAASRFLRDSSVGRHRRLPTHLHTNPLIAPRAPLIHQQRERAEQCHADSVKSMFERPRAYILAAA